jgi:mRNA interferase MazF
MIELDSYDNWNNLKKVLNRATKNKFFKSGQIWWCIIGKNVGSEVYGKSALFSRPILVYKKFSTNLFLGIPLTSKQKSGTWYISFDFKQNKMIAMMYQIRIFDQKRLTNYIGQIKDTEMEKIKTGFLDLFS